MLTVDRVGEIINRVVREARVRWKEAWVDRVKVGRSRIYVYMVVGGYNVKVILYRSKVKVRVYSRLKGLSIALQRIFEREYRKAMVEKRL